MKLIIDIPEEDFKWIQTHRSVTDYQITQMLYKRVMNGIPLDDVKFQIEHMACRQYEHRLTLDRQEVIEILDNIVKAESEDIS